MDAGDGLAASQQLLWELATRQIITSRNPGNTGSDASPLGCPSSRACSTCGCNCTESRGRSSSWKLPGKVCRTHQGFGERQLGAVRWRVVDGVSVSRPLFTPRGFCPALAFSSHGESCQLGPCHANAVPPLFRELTVA